MAAPVRRGLCVLPDAEAMSRHAALLFAERTREASSTGRCTIALSGGSTPRRFFKLLGSAFRDLVPWGDLHVFWVDERCVPPEHQDSNFRTAHETFLSHVPVPSSNIHRITGELPPEEAARAYESELRRHFGERLPSFDLILLGVGEDGHTASLFPGSASLAERARTAIPVYAERLNSWRVTLTLPVLNNASLALFLAAGPAKSHVIGTILGCGAHGEAYPAALISPDRGEVQWLIDREAAGSLSLNI
jgi:6-phosphogluconolactonase